MAISKCEIHGRSPVVFLSEKLFLEIRRNRKLASMIRLEVTGLLPWTLIMFFTDDSETLDQFNDIPTLMNLLEFPNLICDNCFRDYVNRYDPDIILKKMNI